MTFGEDVEFLKQHVDTIVLKDEAGRAQLVVVPQYQGRVMTSSATGVDGISFGWINYEHIESGEIAPHMNAYGGEERFWLGPEGGQFGIYFKPGGSFVFADWQTPPPIDTEAFALIESDDQQAVFRHQASLRNYSDAPFDVRIDRTVKLLDRDEAAESLGVAIDDVDFVGYRTTNQITNIGDNDWSRKTGLLSIWMLGMYKPGPQTTVVIPFKPGSVSQLGRIVNDSYFGKVPSERLVIQDDLVFFSGDGTYRSKIGFSPRRATNICGSYDAARGVLTIVKYNKPGPEVTDYVNSMWEIQQEPYGGDVVNSYNDGPPEPGAEPMGPFYELETSSPALALKRGESGEHISETYHFQGSADALDLISRKTLGVSLQQIQSALQ